jgi:hypothetical protein
MRKVQSAHYKAYLLRLWREGETGDWRAILEDAHSDSRRGFANLDALIEHLRELTESGNNPGTDDKSILVKGEKK